MIDWKTSIKIPREIVFYSNHAVNVSCLICFNFLSSIRHASPRHAVPSRVVAEKKVELTFTDNLTEIARLANNNNAQRLDQKKLATKGNGRNNVARKPAKIRLNLAPLCKQVELLHVQSNCN